jgi:putative toxin-antitoxin system antitoxin component (TIGR02293 family)
MVDAHGHVVDDGVLEDLGILRDQRRIGGEVGERLTTQESSRVERVARVWALAVKVWKSDESARAFLWREHPLLDLRRPIDVVMANDLGAKLVEDILGRLRHGTAA